MVRVTFLVATLPIVVPYLFVSDPKLAARPSNLVGLTMLFLLGAWWGRVVGGRSLRIAAGLTLLGVALVLVTIAWAGSRIARGRSRGVDFVRQRAAADERWRHPEALLPVVEDDSRTRGSAASLPLALRPGADPCSGRETSSASQ